jgi:GNAT superfamily N-acetyltransferase
MKKPSRPAAEPLQQTTESNRSWTFAPATPDRWPDIEALFAGCGDARRCWCGFWYRANKDFRAGYGGDNRHFLQAMVEAGRQPGILAYRDGAAVGWCGIAPRADQFRLARSRVLAPVDDRPVWSITCFVVAHGFRRQGLMRPLIAAAVDFARERGAGVIEAYPLDAARKLYPGEIYVGTIAAFHDQGFAEVARRSPTRPIMRREL